MRETIGVGAVFSAAHWDSAKTRLHGHSYEVVAWFLTGEPGPDALAMQRALTKALSQFDHGVLPDHLSRAEDIAVAVMKALPGCVEVRVNRPLERIYARVVA